MTLAEYLRRESPYLAHLRRWRGVSAYLCWGLLILLAVLVTVAPDAISPCFPLGASPPLSPA